MERSRLDGTERMIFVQGNMAQPIDLAVDYLTSRLVVVL